MERDTVTKALLLMGRNSALYLYVWLLYTVCLV